MDISDTLAPDSDQLDAIDLATGPRIFTVKSVSKGDAEQPVQVHLVEFPRGPWRPGKNMRRVLAACWGVDASAWAGRRVELYCDPAVRFGADVVGGTRIARLSHIDKQQQVPLLVSRGRSATFTVQPLPENAGAAPAGRIPEESPTSPEGQIAAPAEPVADPELGDGLILDSLEHAQRLVNALSNGEQLATMKRMLGLDGKTTRRLMAEALFKQREGWDGDDILREMAGW